MQDQETKNPLTRFIPTEVLEADVLYISHSGGKDSQAALAFCKRAGLLHKCVIIHADLEEMEWEEMHPWISQISFDLEVNVTRSPLNFFDLARKYKRLPSGMQQFCTDFLKTQPIKAWIHNHMDENGYKTAINITGMRAEESPRRAKKEPFTLSKGKGTSGMHMTKKHPEHTIWDYMPIFHYTEKEVYQEIENANQSVHRIYSMGFSRLSCAMCVNGRISEHQEAARLRPKLARKMANLERELGKTVRLKQVKGVKQPKYMDEYLEALAA